MCRGSYQYPDDKPAGDAVSGSRKASRKQPIVSCAECRRMKWKCDRQFPCSNCRRRGVANLCPGGRLQPVKGQSGHITRQISELQSHLKVLHNALRAARAQGFDIEDIQFDSTISPDDSSDRQEENDSEFANGQLIVGVEPGSSAFVGNGGAHYDWRIDSAESASGSTRPVSSPIPLLHLGVGESLAFPCPSSSDTVQSLLLRLPTQDRAARWAQIYFEDAAVLNCTLERQSFFDTLFRKAYSLSPSRPAIRNQDLALVFFVLASGAAMDLLLPACNDNAEELFNTGRSCLSLDPSDSISLIQAVHLMSRYISNAFKGPRSALRFWTSLGMAVRCAQSIGLHRDGSKWHLSQDEVEMRRRVFWEIHTEDVLQSMTQARPKLMNDAAVDCELPARLRDGSEDDIGRSTFHHYKYLLVRILTKVNDVQVNVKPFAYREILKIHNELKKFEETLPDELRVEESSKSHVRWGIAWQRLTMRSLNVEGYMFLHRAQFARALRDAPNEPLASSFHFSYVAELEASRQVLIVLQQALSLHPLFASRFLIFFFHAFTAVVNFSAVVIRSPRSSLAAAAYAQAKQGLALFESLPEDCKARNDLPLLRNLLQQARESLDELSHRNSTSTSELDILGIGTKLYRLPSSPLTKEAENTHSETSANPFLLADNLPTIFTDAFLISPQEGFQMAPYEVITTQHQPVDAALPGWVGSDMATSSANNDLGVEPDTSNSEWDLHAFMVSIGLFPEET